MSEIVPGEVIQRLEQRHAELIDELDALNHRLEEALSSFQKAPEHSQQQALGAEAVQ